MHCYQVQFLVTQGDHLNRDTVNLEPADQLAGSEIQFLRRILNILYLNRGGISSQ
jgi:hypothetical protein